MPSIKTIPNPFNPITTIEFELPDKSLVSLKIFNILGEEVTALVNQELAAGKYRFQWDSRKAASGTYYYRLEAGKYHETRKMIFCLFSFLLMSEWEGIL